MDQARTCCCGAVRLVTGCRPTGFFFGTFYVAGLLVSILHWNKMKAASILWLWLWLWIGENQ